MRLVGESSAIWRGGLGLGGENVASSPSAGPTITAPGSIDVSTFKIGTTQTITAGTATASGGGAISYEFRHLANGEVKSISAAYAHVAADDTEEGLAQWRAVETGGTSLPATAWQTVASGTITYTAPVNTVAPAVSGNTGLGDVLSVSQGTWTGSDISFTYQWKRDTVDISNATDPFYTITAADDNASMTCEVTATNSGGSASELSNAITVDNFAIPSITGVPTISGAETVGSVLTATAASTSGNPAPSRTWQWERNGAPISGATNSTYTLVGADAGETLTVVQTETNGIGSDSAESVATGVITGTDTTAPAYQSSTVSGDRLSVILTYDETLDGAHVPDPGDFTISQTGWSGSITGVSVSGAQVTLSLSTALLAEAGATTPLGDVDISGVTTSTALQAIIDDPQYDNSDYNDTLTKWAAQVVTSGLAADFGGSAQYDLTGYTNRKSLIDDDGWTITDGGVDPSALGSELATNGDFATGDLTGWSDAGGTAAVVSNQVTLTGMSGANRLNSDTAFTVGSYYNVEFEIISSSGGSVRPYSGALNGANESAPGVYNSVVGPLTSATIGFRNASGAFTGTLDNISIKELT